MDLETAIRTRRTHKVYGSAPVDRETLEGLIELARWAPNHNLTNPWRFRVVGPRALERLKAAVGPDGAAKLDRAPTLVVVSYVRTPDDPVADEEDLLAAGVAAYIVLLGAHTRGLAAYWRTVPVLKALGLPDDELPIGLLYLGEPRHAQRVPERAPVEEIAYFLD
jgi:nitroreductase